ncbi:thioredoxin family protein [Foetidibacter luteolus]|uniref:thioredoxin family protein n=1 Tax=Foetidibacter luteolus TaxID=2608880 RepID=UPI001A987462|nr:thioredoxin family protein [Foetidibacter luteolus]
MKFCSVILVALCLFVSACQRRMALPSAVYNNIETVNARGDKMLLGHCPPYLLSQGTYKHWYDTAYLNYKPDQSIVQSISPLLKNKTIQVFLGTWCGDSRREVPRMMKVLQSAGMDTGHIQLIFVSNAETAYKQSPQHEERGRNIHHIPTFIVYDKGHEMNRIVEWPVQSLEKDLLAILQRQPYTPKYKAVVYWQKNITGRNVEMSDLAIEEAAAACKPLVASFGEFNAYGVVLFYGGNPVEALNVLRLNALLYPQNSMAYENLGEVYLLTDKNKAKASLEKALLLNPKSENAMQLMKRVTEYDN